MIQAILQLHASGLSRRAIARRLGVHRDTVARLLRQSQSEPKPASAPSGSDVGMRIATDTPPPPEPAILRPAPPGHTGQPSACEPFRDLILAKLEQELSAQRIFQDLSADHNYGGSYYSVRRFVQKLQAKLPWPMRRLECAPGFEAQVDYGSGAPVTGVDGKRRKTHVFRIVLSHSRKAYSEASFRQTTDDFIGALENAFWSFGGVPQTIVIDNLKAAVKHPDWYDPELQPKLRTFCEHYHTAILPTRPYTPRHKGKVERGIGYVKANGLKARTFDSLKAENRHLADWERSVADTRIHGTTQQQVQRLFEEAERPALQPLPRERFVSFQEAQRIVNRDGHIEVAKAYYSVPPEYLGHTVWVRWDARVVRVFNQRWQEIAVHVRHEQGRFSTQGAHLAPEKISGLERGARGLMNRVRLIGSDTEAWAEAMLTARGIEGTRVLMGLLALTKRHSSAVLQQACKTALSHGEFRLRALRALIARPPQTVQATLPFLDEHALIRPLEDYARVVAAAAARKPHDQGAPIGDVQVGFKRQNRANECATHKHKSPGGDDRQGSRDIHPPGSGYSSPGCSPAEPGSASPDSSSLRSPSPPLPGESCDE
ncbi:MAG: IS21 family transposase [Deltaproteobacteria bacterium]